jgi:ribosomal protein L19E
MSTSVNNSANAGDSNANASSENNTSTETTSTSSSNGSAEGSAARLLEESKNWKKRATQAEKELEDLKKKEAESQGQFKKLYEEEKKRNEEISKSYIRTQVKMSVDDLAKKAGCVNVEALMKLGNPELLEYNQENGNVYGADLFIEDAKKHHPYLFSAGVKPPTINPATPGGVVPGKKLTVAEILKLPPSEQKKYWAAALQNSAKK